MNTTHTPGQLPVNLDRQAHREAHRIPIGDHKRARGTIDSPEPMDIRMCRVEHHLTQKSAARLVFCSERTWQDWEAGAARMHPATWTLFRIRLRFPDVLELLR